MTYKIKLMSKKKCILKLKDGMRIARCKFQELVYNSKKIRRQLNNKSYNHTQYQSPVADCLCIFTYVESDFICYNLIIQGFRLDWGSQATDLHLRLRNQTTIAYVKAILSNHFINICLIRNSVTLNIKQALPY